MTSAHATVLLVNTARGCLLQPDSGLCVATGPSPGVPPGLCGIPGPVPQASVFVSSFSLVISPLIRCFLRGLLLNSRAFVDFVEAADLSSAVRAGGPARPRQAWPCCPWTGSQLPGWGCRSARAGPSFLSRRSASCFTRTERLQELGCPDPGNAALSCPPRVPLGGPTSRPFHAVSAHEAVSALGAVLVPAPSVTSQEASGFAADL